MSSGLFTFSHYFLPECGEVGFGIPIFTSRGSTRWYASEVQRNTIVDFLKVDLEGEKPQSNSAASRVQVGSPAVLIYVKSNADVVRGSVEEILDDLHLEYEEKLRHDPFLALQIAEVAEIDRGAYRALEQICRNKSVGIPAKHRSSFISSIAREAVWKELLKKTQTADEWRSLERNLNQLQVSIDPGGIVSVKDYSEGRLLSKSKIEAAVQVAEELVKDCFFEQSYGLARYAKRVKAPDELLTSLIQYEDNTGENRHVDGKLRQLKNLSQAPLHQTRFALLLMLVLSDPNSADFYLRNYRDKSTFVNRMIAHLRKFVQPQEVYSYRSIEELISDNIGHFVSGAYYGNRGMLLLALSEHLRPHRRVAQSILERTQNSRAFDIQYLRSEILGNLKGSLK